MININEVIKNNKVLSLNRVIWNENDAKVMN